jgi:type VI secretion system protein ImpC
MSDAQKAQAKEAVAQTQETSLLDQIVEQGRLARDPAAAERGKNLVKEFLAYFLIGLLSFWVLVFGIL